MSENLVYLNGKVVPADEAGLSVFDTGFLHGASVFTTMLGHNGRAFRLDRHLRRLFDNAGRIGLEHTATAEELAAAVGAVLKANKLSQARIRITLSPGPAVEQPRPTTVVTASAPGNQPQWYTKGIGVIVNRVVQYHADPLGGVKTGCYLPRILARQAAAAVGADEALWFTTQGHLAEACFSNVFLVRAGALATPPLATPVLPGIVREAVIELCDGLGIDCAADEPLTGEDVQSAREIFVTSSVAGIRPVVRVNRQPVGDEKPAPVTNKIMTAYRKLLDEECPEAS